MSDYESHYGKLRKVDLEGKTIEEFFEQKCKEEGFERVEYDEDWYACYYANAYPQKYFKSEENVWEVFDHIESKDLDNFRISNNNDGTYTFSTMFYNGGTALSEILEEEIAKL